MKSLITAMTLAVVALSAPRVATAGDFQQDFGLIDRDGDGALSWTEYKSRVMEMLYFADRNNDGALSRDESNPAWRSDWSAMDRNGDGMVSSTEFVAFHKRGFQNADGNADARLTREEIQAASAG